MSTGADLLLYTGYERTAIDDFNERLGKLNEWTSVATPISTQEANGPRVFCGQVLAVGLDGGSVWGDDLQAILDAVNWSHPHQVVAILRNYDLDPAEAEVYRPHYRIDTGYYEDAVTQLGPKED